ncbi:UNVERIFIED_CONTAM: hypothetical protein K2H54_017600 [Gekko kuhli]
MGGLVLCDAGLLEQPCLERSLPFSGPGSPHGWPVSPSLPTPLQSSLVSDPLTEVVRVSSDCFFKQTLEIQMQRVIGSEVAKWLFSCLGEAGLWSLVLRGHLELERLPALPPGLSPGSRGSTCKSGGWLLPPRTPPQSVQPEGQWGPQRPTFGTWPATGS